VRVEHLGERVHGIAEIEALRGLIRLSRVSPQGLDHASEPLDLGPDRSEVSLLFGPDIGTDRLIQREPEKLQMERHRVKGSPHVVRDLLEEAGDSHEVGDEEALLDLTKEGSVAECDDGDAYGIGRLVHEFEIPGTRGSDAERWPRVLKDDTP
jgi:hypothetical protein